MKQLLLFVCLVLASCQTYSQVNKIKMKQQSSGSYTVKCTVNGIPMNFIFDTGASLCSIGLTEALFLLKSGYISKKDFVSNVEFSIADGSTIIGKKVILREIEIGEQTYRDVETIIVEKLDAPLLLGQNILSDNSAVLVDYVENCITFFDSYDYDLLSKQLTTLNCIEEIEVEKGRVKKLNEELKSTIKENEILLSKSKESYGELKIVKEEADRVKMEADRVKVREMQLLEELENLKYIANNSIVLPPNWSLLDVVKKSRRKKFWKKTESGRAYYNFPSSQSKTVFVENNERYKVLQKRLEVKGSHFNVLFFKNHGVLFDWTTSF